VAARLYKKLRKAVVENVYENWKETGYAWEQYDSITGKGQRTAHFLGWTSLVINMMSMPETVSVPLVGKVTEEVEPVVGAVGEKAETVVEKVQEAKSVVEEVVEEVKEAAVEEPEAKPVIKDEL